MQTVSAVQSFFLATALYPEVQKKAQKEIDAVIGNNRLPDFSDRDALPYTNAIVKEAMRWQPVTPLGKLNFSIKLLENFGLTIILEAAHMCTADDEYDGYFIPKGTLVLGNTWLVSSWLINDRPSF